MRCVFVYRSNDVVIVVALMLRFLGFPLLYVMSVFFLLSIVFIYLFYFSLFFFVLFHYYILLFFATVVKKSIIIAIINLGKRLKTTTTKNLCREVSEI